MSESKMVSRLALTPALSPTERENPPPRSREPNRQELSLALPRELPIGGGCGRLIRSANDFQMLFPLPGGEGQGEGERGANSWFAKAGCA